ncbi:hypothetical protein IKG60_00825 [Candidatus Saccharibacteria bacterium]|nr:hypothetical protein [Candidatus Saccharibacteria bacterium]
MGLLKERNNNDKAKKHDWRNFDTLPSKVITKSELDQLQKEVVDEIETTLDGAIAKSGVNNDAKPQALFYCHKYIDSKFNKNNFDIDSYYHAKQNLIDQMYAEGLGEVEAELNEYSALVERTRAVEQRMRRKENVLDPESSLDETGSTICDDSEELRTRIADLPRILNWQIGKEQ